jgi:protein-S-isoprenylcysteine O-methyltransferase Ste14
MNDLERPSADRADVRVPPAVFFLPMAVAAAFHYFVWPLNFTLPIVLGGSIGRIVIGGLLGLIGLGLPALSIAQFRKTGQKVDVAQPTTSIIRTGPYRFTRNPMYLGAMLAHLGVGTVIGSVGVLAALVPAVVLAQALAIVPEERYLERKFGDEYSRYKASVRRWL